MTLHQISRKLVSRFFFFNTLICEMGEVVGSISWISSLWLGLLFLLFLICFVSLSFWVNVCVDMFVLFVLHIFVYVLVVFLIP